MSSLLESVPHDVLEVIALLACSSVFEPPRTVLSLLLTSRTMYSALSVTRCPQLYAKLFQSKFDFDASRRFENGLTDSALTAELVQRHSLLRRIRRRDFTESGLLQDLWTFLWMIQEGNGLNESQLQNAGATEFIILVMCEYLKDSRFRQNEEAHLSLWLTALTLSTSMC